jgi:hypothetical protein
MILGEPQMLNNLIANAKVGSHCYVGVTISSSSLLVLSVTFFNMKITVFGLSMLGWCLKLIYFTC